jgi:hypothetical protein
MYSTSGVPYAVSTISSKWFYLFDMMLAPQVCINKSYNIRDLFSSWLLGFSNCSPSNRHQTNRNRCGNSACGNTKLVGSVIGPATDVGAMYGNAKKLALLERELSCAYCNVQAGRPSRSERRWARIGRWMSVTLSCFF